MSISTLRFRRDIKQIVTMRIVVIEGECSYVDLQINMGWITWICRQIYSAVERKI